MDEPIEEIDVAVMEPIPYEERQSPPPTLREDFNRFADWIMEDFVSQRRIDRRVEGLRREVERIYQRYDNVRRIERQMEMEMEMEMEWEEREREWEREWERQIEYFLPYGVINARLLYS